MNFPSIARLKALSATPSALLAFRNVGSAGVLGTGFSGGGYFSFPRSSYVDGYYFSMQSATYANMWITQPEIRSVTSFIAQNFMQVPLDLFSIRPASATPDSNHPAMQSIRNPREHQGMGMLLEAIANDLLVFDNAYILKIRVLPLEQTTLLRIPPYAVGVKGNNRLVAQNYRITYADGNHDDYTADQMIHIPSYNALDPRVGVSRMEALKQILTDSATRRAASIEFNRSGRLRGGFIERPLEAPTLDDVGREALEGAVSRRMAGSASQRVVTLDEGMHWNDAGVNPREADVLRMTTLSYVEVCHAFGLHPDVMGIREQSSALVEARKQMYMDVLPPIGDRMAEAFKVQLLEADYDVKPNTKEFRFDWQSKLEGDPIERMARGTSAAGRPFMTVNEVRAQFGYPPVEGGDELVVPTNVVASGNLGGLPAPNVMPIPNPNTPAQDGTHREGDPNVAKSDELGIRTKSLRINAAFKRRFEYHAEHETLMKAYFGRQERSLQKGGKADSLRWDTELADDLYNLSLKTVKREGEIVGSRLMGSFDTGQVENYLKAGAEAMATAINKVTAYQIQSGSVPKDVFAIAKEKRANDISRTQANHLLNFAAVEAAKQNPGPEGTMRVKTWITESENSRHKALNQKSIAVDKVFENGSRFPGDPKVQDYSQNVNCKCVIDVY